MAHKKSGGAKAKQGGNVAGKRLGVKIYAGKEVSPGEIIVRQRGTKFHSGDGTGIGRDHTIFSKEKGIVNFKKRLGKKVIEVKGAN